MGILGGQQMPQLSWTIRRHKPPLFLPSWRPTRCMGRGSRWTWGMDDRRKPTIQCCIIETLKMRETDSLFSTYTDECSTAFIPLSPLTIAATHEQDAIRLQHFLKGRISGKWRVIQHTYYWSISSRHSSWLWAKEFVSNILTLIHLQWKARNAVVHVRDKLGLKVQEGHELETAVTTYFELGASSLLLQDQHLITQWWDKVDQMTAARKRHGCNILLSRERSSNTKCETETTCMRDYMIRWQQNIRNHQN